MPTNVSAFLLLIAMCVSCSLASPGEGSVNGKLVDVSWEGFLFKSCEAGIQYGTDSSKIEFVSSTSKEVCDKLSALIGRVLKVTYDTEFVVIRTLQNEIILTYEELKQPIP